ncbi:MAG: thioredoxin family protein [Candidatus Hydrogenedentales bacterium]|jgi:peroxiredoxin
MALTASTMLALGTHAPDFSLPDTDGRGVALKDFEDKRALLVMFICNHCPYVKHVRDELAQLSRDYQSKGVGMVAINANDVEAYPQDGVEAMRAEKQTAGYLFPYLFDESQETAKAYGAACTPDFFVFDSDRKLVYRGRLDDARPGNGLPVTGRDLRAALDAVLAGQPVAGDQEPSMGCNIKWKPGNAPVYG